MAGTGRNTLGTVIKERRLALGLTQEELAERIGDGVRQAEVSRLERDRISLPRPQRLRRIALALDLLPGELLARSGWAGADAAFIRQRRAVTETRARQEYLGEPPAMSTEIPLGWQRPGEEYVGEGAYGE
ncbi:MAG: Helix-turn-helix domain [Thermomicrobiales bacterium]|jgi:transcriptional regulator with XRE-family HTH domain|nr:Helix-turn-helix domain [Thermomicrobiales bacterium]MEA2525781.1 Helix-turn-helix domain [Thermomicrobiales bacterium]MEA2528671.1 Helix-turn-helix domain [Thermomicrobiales bacterium]MEA2593718.1 Helix-turn-helix domain [Thermomicrobiales bacterium]